MKISPGLYYADSANILCLVYPDERCEKIYLGGGSALMDNYLNEDTWYEGYVLPQDNGWTYIGEI